jgi:hypothetical protein
MPRAGGWGLLLAAAVLVMSAAPTAADSELRLVYPAVFETVPASTYDAEHRRVGSAHLVIEKLANGNVRLIGETGIDGGERTVVNAELVPIDGGQALRPRLQESRSFRADGTPMGVLSIDHRARLASCSKIEGDEMLVQEVALPKVDRVANVPLNLLFLPLIHGEAEHMKFQLFICRQGARFVDFEARVAPLENGSNGNGHVVEVRYAPDLGSIVSMIAKGFIPKLSFWFDPTAANPWIAHRLPLFAKGPEVFVIREGVSPRWLDDGR